MGCGGENILKHLVTETREPGLVMPRRLELATDIGTPEQYAELKRVSRDMLDEWSRTKKAPSHAAWLHEIAREENAKKAAS